DPEARNGDAPTVDLDVAVTDELPGREHGRHEFRSINDGIEPALQQADQVRAGIALHPDRVLVDAAELPLGDVAVIAAQLLLGAQLHAVVGELALAALTVLARAILAAVHGTLGAAPDVLPHAAVELVFRFTALGHRVLMRRLAPVGNFEDRALLRRKRASGRQATSRSAKMPPRVAKRHAGPLRARKVPAF